jgi:putative transposase
VPPCPHSTADRRPINESFHGRGESYLSSSVVENAAAVTERCIRPGELTLSTDNGTAFTGRAFRARLAELGSSTGAAATATPNPRRSSSWFSGLKQRCVSCEEFETSTKPAKVIGGYVDRYHQGVAYRTPREVAATWKDAENQSIPAA